MQHPAFYAFTRLALRRALRAKGYGPFKISDALDDASDDVIDAAATTVSEPPKFAAEGGPVVGATPILDAILAFLGGPAGQALIAALLKLLGL